MSDTANSLSKDIRTIIKLFDADDTMADNLHDLATVVAEDIP